MLISASPSILKPPSSRVGRNLQNFSLFPEGSGRPRTCAAQASRVSLRPGFERGFFSQIKPHRNDGPPTGAGWRRRISEIPRGAVWLPDRDSWHGQRRGFFPWCSPCPPCGRSCARREVGSSFEPPRQPRACLRRALSVSRKASRRFSPLGAKPEPGLPGAPIAPKRHPFLSPAPLARGAPKTRSGALVWVRDLQPRPRTDSCGLDFFLVFFLAVSRLHAHHHSRIVPRMV